MFEALAITLREGVEAALVLAIALAFLRRRGLDHLRGALFGGAALALVVSAVLAVLASRVRWNEELAEGVAMLVGFVLVGSLVWWMWRSGPHMKQDVELGLERAASVGGSALAVALFAFGMVLREGVETAIFLSAAGFTSEGLGIWLGALAGLGLAAVFGLLFVRGSVRFPLKPFFSLTSSVLSLIAIQLLIGGLHELSEAQVLPSSRAEMALIGPFIKNELLLFTLTVALAAGWLLWGSGTRPPGTTGATSGQAGDAATRLAEAGRRADRTRRRWSGAIGVQVVGLLAVATARESRIPDQAPASAVTFDGGIARLDLAPLEDGHAHFFAITMPERTVRFFAVRVGDEVRTCFDACEICGAKGYFENGANMVCRNCTSPIVRASLGRTGGCNPIPLPHAVVTDSGVSRLEIRADDVRAALPRLGGR